MLYRIGYWIGSRTSRTNGTYKTTLKAWPAITDDDVRQLVILLRSYEARGYLAELIPA